MVRIVLDPTKILAMLVQGARLVPALRDSGVVLPLVEETEVLFVLVIETHHREGLLKVRNPAAIDHRARGGFRRADRVPRLLV